MPNQNYLGRRYSARLILSETEAFVVLTDYTPFGSTKFDATAYANAVLAGETYNADEPPPLQPKAGVDSKEAATKVDSTERPGGLTVKGDVSVALAKLNYGIEDIDRQIRSEVSRSMTTTRKTNRSQIVSV